MPFGASQENIGNNQDSQEKKTLGNKKSQQPEDIFQKVENAVKEELKKNYWAEGQQIFETYGISKINKLKEKNSEIFDTDRKI